MADVDRKARLAELRKRKLAALGDDEPLAKEDVEEEKPAEEEKKEEKK